MQERGDVEERGDAGEPSAPGTGSLSDALRHHRRAAGLTQEALAERAGVGLRTLQGLEAGECRPLRATVHRLAEGLRLVGEAQAQFTAPAAPLLRVPRVPPAGPPHGSSCRRRRWRSCRRPSGRHPPHTCPCS